MLDESFEEPLRRRRNDAEIIRCSSAIPGPQRGRQVINAFVSAGLLRRFGASPNSQIEVTHEALLRHWDHIHRLVTGAEVKERLHLIKQIGRASGEWVEHDRSNGYLSLRGERLDRAISYANDGWLAEAESTAYVEACRGREAEIQLKENRRKKEWNAPMPRRERVRPPSFERSAPAATCGGWLEPLWSCWLLSLPGVGTARQRSPPHGKSR